MGGSGSTDNGKMERRGGRLRLGVVRKKIRSWSQPHKHKDAIHSFSTWM